MNWRINDSPLTELVKQHGEPKTPQEMRALMERAALDSILLHNAYCSRFHGGLCGEDVYTVIAYHALLENERSKKQLFDWHLMWPTLDLLERANADSADGEPR